MQFPKCGNEMTEGYERTDRVEVGISFSVLYLYPDDEVGVQQSS